MKNSIFSKTNSMRQMTIFLFLHISLISGVQEDSWILVPFAACSLLHCHPACSFWETPMYTREEMSMKKAKNVASWKPVWSRRSSWKSIREHPGSWRALGEPLQRSFRKCSNHPLFDPVLKPGLRSKWCFHSLIEEEPEIPAGLPLKTAEVPRD